MNELTGITEQVNYEAVCSNLMNENEELRASLSKMYRLLDTWEDVKHVCNKVIQPFKKNPYLLVVVCYIVLSTLDFFLRRNHEG